MIWSSGQIIWFHSKFGRTLHVKESEGKVVAFLVLYVDDILFIRNDMGMLSTVKVWLANNFDMKDLGEASYILGIELFRDQN